MRSSKTACICLVALASAAISCNNSMIFNPAFINQQTGEYFPLVPQERTGFILVRGNNATTESAIEFLITVERQVASETIEGAVDIETESVRLFAPAAARANDVGILIDCPAYRIGLGENLDRPTTEPGIYVDAEAVGVGGLGVPANVNPLSSDAGNFECGDTIIFQAIEAANTVGGVKVNAYVLKGDQFSEDIIGIDTFANARSLIEEQLLEDE